MVNTYYRVSDGFMVNTAIIFFGQRKSLYPILEESIVHECALHYIQNYQGWSGKKDILNFEIYIEDTSSDNMAIVFNKNVAFFKDDILVVNSTFKED